MQETSPGSDQDVDMCALFLPLPQICLTLWSVEVPYRSLSLHVTPLLETDEETSVFYGNIQCL